MNHRIRWTGAGVCAALILVLLLAGAPTAAYAQAAQKTVSAMLISDVHFEPFWDPDKVPDLKNQPLSNWDGILSSAPSSNQAAKFDEMQKQCHARGVDTPYALLESSLKAMRAHAAGISFVTVSGDLIAHYFDCKYR